MEGHRSDEDVHESRKSVKKVEALATLLKQLGCAPPRKDLERLSEARRILSKVRDADATIETFDRLRSRFSHRIPLKESTAIRMELRRQKTQMRRRAQA